MTDKHDPEDAKLQAEKAEVEKAEREAKIAWVREQVAASVPVECTPGEKYLIEHRGLLKPFPQSIRWAATYRAKQSAKPRSCLLSIVTNDKREVVAVQSLEINTKTGAKACKTKPDRFSNGPVSEGAVFLGSAENPMSILTIGEGVESTLTRALVSACDSYACLGAVRFILPKAHHKRVEILADTDKRDAARRLARQYADRGLPAYVVTVSHTLGDKADLNDALRQSGLSAVRMAVEDAEVVLKNMKEGLKNLHLKIGSDIEIAQLIIERLEEIYGTIVVSEGKIWRFDRTHWIAFDNDNLARFVHRSDGAIYYGPDGNERIVKLNKSRVNSILDAVFKYRQEPAFFKMPPCGINCESGFIRIADDGSIEHLSHARQWRQRHVVRGRWHGDGEPENWACSDLARYLKDAFSGDDDAEQKILLLGEVTGCAATGRGTKVRNPKAIVAYSEQGATGKSTFLRLLRATPNSEAVASVPAGKFADEKYSYHLIGKVLNAADELPDRAIRSDVFKRMITGEPVPARDVYCSAVDFEPVALHVFSTNVLPSFSGGIDGGTERRLLPIEFTHVVPEAERDPDLPTRIIHNEADLLLHFAVEGARRLIRQGDFTIPASCKKLLDRWLVGSDPVRAWAAERLEVTGYESIVALADLYRDFEAWAMQRGLKRDFLPNAISFGKRLATAEPRLERHRSDGSYYKNVKLRDTL